jgi:hypothetical protein
LLHVESRVLSVYARPSSIEPGEDVVLVCQEKALGTGCPFSSTEFAAPMKIANARLFQGVAMQFSDAAGNDLSALVVPRSIADAIARVDGIGTLRAEIGMPRRVAAAGRGRQRLTMRVGPGETSKVAAPPESDAGHEE